MLRLIFAVFFLMMSVSQANESLSDEVAKLGQSLSAELSTSVPLALEEGEASSFYMDQIRFQVAPNVTFQIPGGIVQLTVTPVVEFFFKKKLPAGYALYVP